MSNIEQLTWQDVKKIVNIADALLDDPKARIAIQNHSEEEYYQKVLDEYNKDVSKGKTQFLIIQNYVHESKENNLSCDTAETSDR